MTQDRSEIATSVKTWALRVGLAGFFGSILTGLSQGGGIAYLIGMSLPIGLVAAAFGAGIGAVVALVRGRK